MSKNLDYTDANAVRSTLIPAEGNDYCPKLIAGSIRSIASNGAKLHARIHSTAHALMSRALDHRDCSLVPALIEAMPKSGRRKALVAWFHAFSNVVIREEKNGKVLANMQSPTAKLFKLNANELLHTAWEKPFWTPAEKDVSPDEFTDDNFMASLRSLLARAEKAGKVNGLKLSDDNVKALATVRSLVPAK